MLTFASLYSYMEVTSKKNQIAYNCHVSFNLRETTPENKPTTIRCIVRYNNLRIVLPSPAKIEPRYWNAKNQRARKNQRTENGIDINNKLDEVSADIQRIFKTYINKNGKYPDPIKLKEMYLAPFNNSLDTTPKTPTLYQYTIGILEDSKNGRRLTQKGTPYNINTLKIYTTFSRNLISFQAHTGHTLKFESIDVNFFNDFKRYLIQDLKYANNTVGKHIKTLNLLVAEARESGLCNVVFSGKNYRAPSEESDSIYLNEIELSKLEALDLNNNLKLDRVRDLFLVGCWTGLRFSDFNEISKKAFKDDNIEIKTKKTGQIVVVPILDTVQRILTKYALLTENSLPEPISNQKMNEYLKEIGKAAFIDEIITVKITKAGKTQVKDVPKFKLITTHTARRSFATNMYKLGIPSISIMAITGHRTESSFMKYIKTTARQHADIIRDALSVRNQTTQN